MSNRRVRAVILCEGRQDEVFARRLLLAKGFDAKAIYIVVAPLGRGSGEQFVREQYPKEVKEYRRNASCRSVALVTMIDADMRTVESRYRQLEGQLTAHGLSGRSPGERIVVLVPKRNIETWIAFLLPPGQEVNETDAYPRLPKESDCEPAVQRLVLLCPRPDSCPQSLPPSLRRGCTELQRLP